MWLHVPGVSHRSVPDTADSNSDSDSPESRLSRSCTWRGKPSQQRTWLARWKREPWLRRLSGLTCALSTLQRGVDAWTSSLRDSHVSRSASQAPGSDSTMSGGSGRTSRESFAIWSPELSSWRTCQVSLFEGSDTYSETWPPSGSMRNGACSERPRQALHTGGLGSSSWPTPTVCGNHNRVGASPTSGDGLVTVIKQAGMWATPRASDGAKGGPRQKFGAGGVPLAAQAHSHLAQTTPKGGDGTSQTVGINPAFVEALMGLPPGWTVYACSATESSHNKPRSHGANSQDG